MIKSNQKFSKLNLKEFLPFLEIDEFIDGKPTYCSIDFDDERTDRLQDNIHEISCELKKGIYIIDHYNTESGSFLNLYPEEGIDLKENEILSDLEGCCNIWINPDYTNLPKNISLYETHDPEDEDYFLQMIVDSDNDEIVFMSNHWD